MSGMKRILLFSLLAGLSACGSARNGQGRPQRLQVGVGEIKEVRVAGRQTGDFELIGTSENDEVVEVSRPEVQPPVDTLDRKNARPTTFQIKGVTTGTARVIFTEKRMGETGSGQPVKAYSVQVTNR